MNLYVGNLSFKTTEPAFPFLTCSMVFYLFGAVLGATAARRGAKAERLLYANILAGAVNVWLVVLPD